MRRCAAAEAVTGDARHFKIIAYSAVILRYASSFRFRHRLRGHASEQDIDFTVDDEER